MKLLGNFILLILFFNTSIAQNTDLPGPTPNLQTLPVNSYVIAMDNTNQNTGVFNFDAIVTGRNFNWTIGSAVLTAVTNTTGILVGMQVQSGESSIPSTATVIAVTATTVTLSAPTTATITNKNVNFGYNRGNFNIKAYGLIVALLNRNIKLKWIITAGKAKDGTDISVNATRIKPTAGSAAVYDFKAGPFVIFPADTTGVSFIVDSFNTAISIANQRINIYKTNASVTADVRYDLSGFIPKGSVLTDGNNAAIHIANYTTAKVPSTNYQTIAAAELTARCFTFVSEPHNTNTGASTDQAIAAIKTFIVFGGNFLAQCHAVVTFENNIEGRFQTTTGNTDANSGLGTAITYPNPDLSFSQYEGKYNISKGGSVQNWRIGGPGKNNFHHHAIAIADPTVVGASVSKQVSGPGGLVFYLGNHRFEDQLTTLTSINGMRMFMNAFLTPNILNQNCNAGDSILPLSVNLVSFYGNKDIHNKLKLGWKISNNEFVDRIEIQMKNNDYDFITIASVNGSQKKGEEDYSLNESLNTEGKILYRLKMIDKAQNVTYSKLIAYTNEVFVNSNRLTIINNPVSDKLSFRFLSSTIQTIDVKIYDMTGRVQLNQKIKNFAGSNNIEINLPPTASSGLYILSVKDDKENYTVKFKKQ